MYKITEHPILPIPAEDRVEFIFEGQKLPVRKGFQLQLHCIRPEKLFTSTVFKTESARWSAE